MQSEQYSRSWGENNNFSAPILPQQPLAASYSCILGGNCVGAVPLNFGRFPPSLARSLCQFECSFLLVRCAHHVVELFVCALCALNRPVLARQTRGKSFAHLWGNEVNLRYIKELQQLC